MVYVYFDITEGLSQDTKDEYMQCVSQICERMDLVNKEGTVGNGFGEIHLSLLNYEYFIKPVIIQIEERNESYDTEIVLKKKVESHIKSFQESLEKLLEFKLSFLDTSRSVIIKHLFEGIRELKKSHYSTKIMIVFSDMIENNPEEELSFVSGQLDESDFNAMTEKIEHVYKMKIPSSSELADIKIYIIRPEHEKYRNQRLVIENYWKHVFGDACIYQAILMLND